MVQTENPRQTALSLLFSMREYDPKCAVWLGSEKLKPTKQEIADYLEEIKRILETSPVEEEADSVTESVTVTAEDAESDALLAELASMELPELNAMEEFDL